MYLMWIVTISLISSIFQGAYTHTIAEIYAGGTSSVNKSIRYGMNKMCSLFLYQFLVFLIFTALALVTLVPATFLALGDDSEVPNFGIIFLGGVIFVVILCIVCSALAAAIPAIVVENKT